MVTTYALLLYVGQDEVTVEVAVPQRPKQPEYTVDNHAACPRQGRADKPSLASLIGFFLEAKSLGFVPCPRFSNDQPQKLPRISSTQLLALLNLATRHHHHHHHHHTINSHVIMLQMTCLPQLHLRLLTSRAPTTLFASPLFSFPLGHTNGGSIAITFLIT
jgi:hypothetical protein